METKPSVTTTALAAPVTGLPQMSSLIIRATRAWIGETHWATTLSSLSDTGQAGDDAADRDLDRQVTALPADDVRPLGDDLNQVVISVDGADAGRRVERRAVDEHATRCVHGDGSGGLDARG